MQKRRLVFWIVIFSSLILLTGCCALLAKTYIDYKKEIALQAADDYKSKTSPLAEDVVQDLCNKLDLPAQDWRCQPETIVYAPEFFDDIKSYLRNLPPALSNREEVDKLLGPYLLSCDPPQVINNFGKPYRCLYDIHGDDVSIIGVYFAEDGSINRVHASTGGS